MRRSVRTSDVSLATQVSHGVSALSDARVLLDTLRGNWKAHSEGRRAAHRHLEIQAQERDAADPDRVSRVRQLRVLGTEFRAALRRDRSWCRAAAHEIL